MALAGLVGNYGSSDEEEEDEGEVERMQEVKGAPAGDSDDDEDEDEGDNSKMDQVPTAGGASGQAAKSKLPSAMELFDAIDGASFIGQGGGKRKDVEDDFPPLPFSKKAKPPPKAQVPPQAGKPGGGRGSSPFVPPQLGRPGGNIVTEDVNAWMTKQQRQDKEKKESWRQKEARKRERGQVSRQGSYQEDEKRILRQFDAESS